MADYFRFYHDWLKQAERLSDSERGRLLAGIAEYSATGILPEFRGNERYLFPELTPAPDSPTQTAQTPTAPPSKPKRTAKQFVPPTLEEVKAYITESRYNVDAQKFMDYFETSGWIDSLGKPVLNWKQKVITWNGRGGNAKKQKERIPQHDLTDEQLSHLIVDLDKDIET